MIDHTVAGHGIMTSLPLQLLDHAQSLYKSYVEPYVSPTSIAILVIVVALTNAYLRYTNLTSSSGNTSGTTGGKKKTTKTKTKDIFDAFRRNKSSQGDAGKEKAAGGDKPFGSSYYYAHNDPNRTGGYKDGLRMEDYVMNGPKLLAKGGKRVEEEGNVVVDGDNNDDDDDEKNSAEDENSGEAPAASAVAATNTAPPVRPTVPTNSVPISKYMWDDAAVASGCSDVGKLYIDTLPNKPSSAPDINWEMASITKADVTAQLLGDDNRSLLIWITRTAATGTEPKSYHLFIRKMYGEVSEVKVVCKAKRLLVKLIKKKSRLNLWDKTNLKPWPQLSEKATAGGGGGSSDDVGYIDESLFKREVGGGGGGMMPQAGPPGTTTIDEKLFGRGAGKSMRDLD